MMADQNEIYGFPQGPVVTVGYHPFFFLKNNGINHRQARTLITKTSSFGHQVAREITG